MATSSQESSFGSFSNRSRLFRKRGQGRTTTLREFTIVRNWEQNLSPVKKKPLRSIVEKENVQTPDNQSEHSISFSSFQTESPVTVHKNFGSDNEEKIGQDKGGQEDNERTSPTFMLTNSVLGDLSHVSATQDSQVNRSVKENHRNKQLEPIDDLDETVKYGGNDKSITHSSHIHNNEADHDDNFNLHNEKNHSRSRHRSGVDKTRSDYSSSKKYHDTEQRMDDGNSRQKISSVHRANSQDVHTKTCYEEAEMDFERSEISRPKNDSFNRSLNTSRTLQELISPYGKMPTPNTSTPIHKNTSSPVESSHEDERAWNRSYSRSPPAKLSRISQSTKERSNSESKEDDSTRKASHSVRVSRQSLHSAPAHMSDDSSSHSSHSESPEKVSPQQTSHSLHSKTLQTLSGTKTKQSGRSARQKSRSRSPEDIFAEQSLTNETSRQRSHSGQKSAYKSHSEISPSDEIRQKRNSSRKKRLESPESPLPIRQSNKSQSTQQRSYSKSPEEISPIIPDVQEEESPTESSPHILSGNLNLQRSYSRSSPYGKLSKNTSASEAFDQLFVPSKVNTTDHIWEKRRKSPYLGSKSKTAPKSHSEGSYCNERQSNGESSESQDNDNIYPQNNTPKSVGQKVLQQSKLKLYATPIADIETDDLDDTRNFEEDDYIPITNIEEIPVGKESRGNTENLRKEKNSVKKSRPVERLLVENINNNKKSPFPNQNKKQTVLTPITNEKFQTKTPNSLKPFVTYTRRRKTSQLKSKKTLLLTAPDTASKTGELTAPSGGHDEELDDSSFDRRNVSREESMNITLSTPAVRRRRESDESGSQDEVIRKSPIRGRPKHRINKPIEYYDGDLEDIRLRVWHGEGPKRKVTDLTDLDVTLNLIEDNIVSFRDRLEHNPSIRAVNYFGSNMRKDLTSMIHLKHDMRKKKYFLSKTRHNINKTREDLLTAEDKANRVSNELSSLEEEIDKYQRIDDDWEEINSFLVDLEDLCITYKDKHPNPKHTQDYILSSNLPSLVTDCKIMVDSADHLKSLNDRIEEWLNQQ